ncbi:MAG: M2 family metallopeptidase [Phycisphaerae bacterium]|nr:M2 family metallopeptidase [Phycisphaerae bacterium]NUQ46882.1 M2 family metallopeptidase [Phycisphaerae bacterium]
MTRSIILTVVFSLTCLCVAIVVAQTPQAEPKAQPPAAKEDAQRVIDEFDALKQQYLSKYEPLYYRSEKAWWDANVTGADEAFERRTKAQNELVELHADRAVFSRIRSLREQADKLDPVRARELDVMYRTFLPGQADPEVQKKIVALETEVEKTFSTHRSLVGGKELSENDVRQILSESKDSKAAQKAWAGYMAVGTRIAPKLKELVRLRNEQARRLGFDNFYAMKLSLDEIGEKELVALFDELDQLTREPFARLKGDIDAARATRFGIETSALRPWHFGDLFFQQAPETEGANLDEAYKEQDLLALTKTYYEGMGMGVDDILDRSDLYEKPKKNPHAFATDLNRAGDVRVLCNLKPNLYWMDTLIHELGHAVYDKYISPDVPFLLHTASHSITTEGYAMMMGAMVKNEEFLTKVAKLPPEEAARYVESARRSLRAEKLIFSRWAQVMMRFERAMYANPDQDLAKLWWDLKKQYQLVPPPDDAALEGYAAKIHVATVPAYYHSYMMGDLFGCQVHHHIATRVLGMNDPLKTAFVGSREAGRFMIESIFRPGNTYSWNDLTRRITGEPLTARYFARQYVGG